MAVEKIQQVPSIYDPSFVQGLFDRMSGSYERMNIFCSFGFSSRWRRQAIEKIESSSEPLAVLDLMSGMGESWAILKKRLPNAQFSALDFSEGMMARAARTNAKKFGGGFRLFQENVFENTLPSEHFDLIFCAYGLKTLDDERLFDLAQNVKKALKTGGKFIFLEVSAPRGWLFQRLYRFHLEAVTPVLGRLFLGDPIEYRMLWQYVSRFENAKRAASVFEKAGLEVRFDSYFFGCASGFNGSKN